MRKNLFYNFLHMFFILITVANICFSFNQSDYKKVDELFSKWDKPDSPGAVVVIIKNGSVIYMKGYGIANLEYDILITPSTVFHAASLAKQFTAFSIAFLAEKGKLFLDDNIREYLPEIPDYGIPITIRHLIHHTSGLRDWAELVIMAGFTGEAITTKNVMKIISFQKNLNFKPGEEHNYCNTNYTLLAEIVARITDLSFNEWTYENIFKPLGMSRTQFYDDNKRIVKNRAYAYSKIENGGFELRNENQEVVGAIGLLTTVEDLAKWLQNFDTIRVGNSEIIKKILQPGILNNGRKLNYSFGLRLGKYRGLKTVWHAGDWQSRSYILRFPENDFAVAVMSNSQTLLPRKIAEEITNIFLEDQLAPSEQVPEISKKKAAKIDEAILNDYIGNHLLPQMEVPIQIFKEKNTLKGKSLGPFFTLQPESETEFFLVENPEAKISFHKNEKGEVTGITFQLGKMSMNADKIIPAPTENLKEYPGEYFSDELKTTYNLIYEGGNLVLQNLQRGDLCLTFFDYDRFVTTHPVLRKFEFIRDKDNQIAGLLLSGPNVKNLKFYKKQQ